MHFSFMIETEPKSKIFEEGRPHFQCHVNLMAALPNFRHQYRTQKEDLRYFKCPTTKQMRCPVSRYTDFLYLKPFILPFFASKYLIRHLQYQNLIKIRFQVQEQVQDFYKESVLNHISRKYHWNHLKKL